MSIKERQEEVIEEFALFDDWMDKYEHLISLGKELPLIDEEKKVEENIIKGCQSRVWLAADLEDGKINYTADSDAIITKGIISLMIRVLTDKAPKEIAEADLFFIDEVGLKEHLSPTRSNGLVSMVKQMKMYAIAYQTQV
ncbi:MAG: SufE family protein [Vicingaceae bacterium]